MNEKAWMKQLEQEGFTDITVIPIPPNQDFGEHIHHDETVHIILSGDLIIHDKDGTKVYRPGDRVDFPAGTTHKARGSTDSGTMIVGTKKLNHTML